MPAHGVNFEFNVGTKRQLKLFLQGKNTCLYHPRQTGATLFLCGMYWWASKFTNAKLTVIGRNFNDTMMCLDKIDEIGNNLTPFIKNLNLSSSDKINVAPDALSKVKHIIFANDIEYLNEDDLLGMLEYVTSQLPEEVILLSNTTINKNISKDMLICLNDFYTSHSSLKAYPIEDITYPTDLYFTSERIEEFKKMLDEDSFQSEIMQERKP